MAKVGISATDGLLDSRELLGKPDSLRASFAEQGYVYLPGLLNIDAVCELRERVSSILKEQGWVHDAQSLSPAIAPVVEGEDNYFPVYDRIQRLQCLHELAHQQTLLDAMTALLGGASFTHPLLIARLMFPNNSDWDTPPHQDYPNNQGTRDLYASWIPLQECGLSQGPLAVLAGSQKLGILPLEYALGAGHRQAVLPKAAESMAWHCSPMSVGDVLIFHSLTVHKSLANRGESMRLSVDFRFQREGSALTEQCLHPHFKRQPWETIYRDWDDATYQYYWRDKPFTVAPWSDAYHELPEQHLRDAVKQRLTFDRKRGLKN